MKFIENKTITRRIVIHHRDTLEYYAEKEVDTVENDIENKDYTIQYKVSKGGDTILMDEQECIDLSNALFQLIGQ
jgi:hypothetical protein